MKKIAKLRKQVLTLWNQGKSIAQIESELNCSIEIGGRLPDLPCHLYHGNFGIYPK